MRGIKGIVAIVLAFGCGSSTDADPPAPPQIEGRYALVSSNGVPLPIPIIDAPGVRQTILADTIVLQAGVGTDKARFRLVSSGSDSTFDSQVVTRAYTVKWDTVFWGGSTSPDTAIVTATGMVSRFKKQPAQTCTGTRCDWVYVRVP